MHRILILAQNGNATFWNESLQRILATLVTVIVTGLASFVIGRWWGSRVARREWTTKQFLGRINISLNTLAAGKLKIRTIFERTLEEVFHNAFAVEKIRDATDQVTVDHPFLPIDPEDRFYLLNSVLNAVGEKFVWGLIRQDADLEVRPVRYALCLTCEVVGDERIRKVRAMMLREDYLHNFPYHDSMPELERPWHATRIETLRKMIDLYQREPDYFIFLEVCV